MAKRTVLSEDPISARTWNQVGIFVGDGSQSMTLPFAEPDNPLADFLPTRTKAAAVETATREVINLLKVSRKAANFTLGFIYFHSDVTEERPPQDVLKIATADSFDPTAKGTGGTRIHTGLDAAVRMIETYMRSQEHGDVPVSAVVVILSDGEDGQPEKTIAAAQRLKALPNTDVAACLFATKGEPAAGGELLQALASSPRLYQTVYSTQQLRDFFHASVTMAARASASDADTQLVA